MSYEQWPYLTVLLVLLAAGLGLPLPEDVPLLTGGYLCHIERASLPVMIAVALLGVLAGDIFLFTMGRRFGHRIVEHRFFRRLVNPGRLLTAEELFARHGVKLIFIGRFLPVLRPMIFVAAGVLRVRPLVFLGVNGTAACISVPLLVMLGKFFGNSLEQIKRDVRVASHSMLLLIAVALLIGAGVWLHRRQKRLMDTSNVPRGIDKHELASMIPPPTTDNEPASENGHPRKPVRSSSPSQVASSRRPGA
ncbi:MAG TPA: DedA family protein [Phycisphaerae bacterium]|nr:DedA family protein [Phycisphaerae bacterium]HOJ73128.1 DedA family protein [Phycisphaerae bacterium]HOM52219.1 DedA family protein [Phycisphaerae bacterium]HON66919.1 DedA family protein [Phycisphaerae bacterium]HOQ85210.1 DedA family protein [Phycisphaerae bacterium]